MTIRPGRRPTIGETHQSLRERVYAELRERIIEGTYAAGLRLVERDLAEQLGVSRIPLREAMQRLERDGFLTVQARRGSVVTEFGAQDAAYLFDVRESLEGLAAGLAARHATPAQLRTMESLLTRGRTAADAGRLRQAVTCNADFHQQIVEASGNPLLQELMAPLDARLRRLFHLTSDLDDGDPMCGEHERLYEAIRDHDAPRSEEVARRHVAGTRDSALRYFSAAGARSAAEDRSGDADAGPVAGPV
ncbi:GntR family transcriptional regulator [Streptomyces sp. NBC_01020]|uniref:GntR family transcriptional regulator n=1 Tax=unclassified Streptomyces TaxID=2593676 RepID=UPI002E2437ED|nr:GntR family transcriptional regulator [Streptomyces sp. NBC_01020]WSX71290.1 GntR family transcriptional regulator [Streptomyces sp. NBC_00932]